MPYKYNEIVSGVPNCQVSNLKAFLRFRFQENG